MLYRLLVRILLFCTAPIYGLTLGKRKGSPPRRQRMGHVDIPHRPGKRLWIHSVSLGEANLAASLWAALDRDSTSFSGLWTCTTPTGLEAARQAALALNRKVDVVPFPLDHPGAVKRFLDRANPSVLVLVETEIWPELMRQCKTRNIPVSVVNGRISDRALARFKKYRWLFGDAFRGLNNVLARGDQDCVRFRQLGVSADKIKVGGDLKWDAGLTSKDQSALSALLEHYEIAPGEPLLVAGSTRPGEEKIILNAYRELQKSGQNFRLVLAPRHLERAREVAEILRDYDFPSERASILHRPDHWRVLLLDTTGELKFLYGAATVAIIGGTLQPFGGHNPLEILSWEKPLVAGPHGANFADILNTAEKAGALVRLQDPGELSESLRSMFSSETARNRLAAKAKDLFDTNRGALETACDMMRAQLGVARGHENLQSGNPDQR